MGKFFNMDSGIFAILGKMADLMLLNVVFLITCIPIFTIGVAITSLYEVTLKMAKNEESYIIKGYFAAFKINFKKGVILGLIAGGMIIVLLVDFWVVISRTGMMWNALGVGLAAVAFVTLLIIAYLFPIQAKFENTIGNILKNSLLMGIGHLPISTTMVILNCIFPLIFMVGTYQTLFYGLMIFGVIGFALVAYLNSMLLVGVFEKYYPKEEEEVALQDEYI